MWSIPLLSLLPDPPVLGMVVLVRVLFVAQISFISVFYNYLFKICYSNPYNVRIYIYIYIYIYNILLLVSLMGF